MPRLKNPGYVWAALAAPAVLLAMMNSESLSRALASASGVRISPRFSGGEIARTVDHGGYLASIHRPVFDGLRGDRDEGFLQVDWTPVQPLPGTLRETLDICGSSEKFAVVLNTVDGTVSYENGPGCLRGQPQSSRFRSGWAVRIGLKKDKEGERQ